MCLISLHFFRTLNTCVYLNLPRSGHIPVLTAVGESPSGQVLCVESHHAAIRIAEVLQPMKVMFLNTTGGLVDRQGNVSAKSVRHCI